MVRIKIIILFLLALHVTISADGKSAHAIIINASSKEKLYFNYRDTFLDVKSEYLAPGEMARIPFGADAFYPVMVRLPLSTSFGRGVVAMPGDTIYINYNEQEKNYDYHGTHPEELAFSKELGTARFSPLGLYSVVPYNSTTTEFSHFLDEWSKVRIESEGYLRKLRASQRVRPSFKAYLEREIKLFLFSVLLGPAVRHKRSEPLRPFPQYYQDSVAAHAKILDAGSGLPENLSERYPAALRGFAMYLSALEGRYADQAVQYAICKREYKGPLREWACYSALKDLAHPGRGPADLNKDFQEWSTFDSKYKRRLLGIQRLNELPLLQQSGLNDILVTREGEELRLFDLVSKHRGKVIYVDLWASWCKPCLEEFPASFKLQERYAANEVTILYISVDEDAAKWAEADSRHLGGSVSSYRFQNESTSGLVKLFQVKSVPRYMIIDREGTVRYADAPPPSDPILLEMLDRLLLPEEIKSLKN